MDAFERINRLCENQRGVRGKIGIQRFRICGDVNANGLILLSRGIFVVAVLFAGSGKSMVLHSAFDQFSSLFGEDVDVQAPFPVEAVESGPITRIFGVHRFSTLVDYPNIDYSCGANPTGYDVEKSDVGLRSRRLIPPQRNAGIATLLAR